MKDQAIEVLEQLKTAGADYADIRVHFTDESESIVTLNNDIDYCDNNTLQGYGIRVLCNGAWGFASSEKMNSEELKRAGFSALDRAKQAACFIQDKIELAPKKAVKAEYRSPVEIDPFSVDMAEKVQRLLEVTKKLEHERFQYFGASISFHKLHIFYADTEGSQIDRHLMEVNGRLFIMAADADGMQQRRSYSLWQDAEGTVGWENITGDRFDQAERIKNEMLGILDAPKAEEEVQDIILLNEMMALQTHETIGHALELDRILGYELSYAGGSHIDLHHFGELQFGSSKLTARADGTVPNSPGSIGFDDDGVAAKNVVMIEEGKLQNAITSRQMIVEANKKAGKTVFSESGATCRAQSYSNLPIERMNNINVDAGSDGTLEDIIKDTKNGLLLESPLSWSIGSNRENFHFACQIGWKIRDGEITGIVKNPTYRGDSIKFWHSLDKVGDASTWQLQQVFNCGKGQPNQVMRLGHGIPVCRFKDVVTGK